MQEKASQEFLEMYERYADAIYRHCFFRVNCDRALAEDLMQETFLKTWDFVASGKQIDNFRAFLYRVANNTLIDYIRKRKSVSLDALMEQGFDADDRHSTDAQDLAEYTHAKRILAALEEPYKTCVMLRYIDDLSPKDIAIMLGESENTVSVRIHRGLQKIKSHYDHP